MRIDLMTTTGRCANGAQRDAGHLVHAVPGWTDSNGRYYPASFGKALCGKQPGRLTPGWSEWVPAGTVEPTCPRCAKKLAQQA